METREEVTTVLLGRNTVKEALKSGREIDAIYLTEAGNTLREYADSILDKWRKAGVRTMEDVKRQDEKHGGQKTAVKEGTAPAGYRDNQPQLKPQKNKFHNFEQRNTDYDGMVLERLKQRLGES